MGVRKQRATTSATYAMEKEKQQCINKAKRIHRFEEKFYIANLVGWFTSIDEFTFKRCYQKETNIEYWVFKNGRWSVTGECK